MYMSQSKRSDYVVVGGVAAGPVLAIRLGKNTDRSVLLLEAGRTLRPGDAPEAARNAFFVGREPVWDDIASYAPGTPAELRARVLGGDASIMSDVLSVATNPTVIMVAEVITDRITAAG